MQLGLQLLSVAQVESLNPGLACGAFDAVMSEVGQVEILGLHSVWVPNFFGMDALTCVAVLAREYERVEFGTSIVPIYTRHPFAMAQQALTVQAAAHGRFTLGLGLSHRRIVEQGWGLLYDRPATAMRRYLGDLKRYLPCNTEESASAGIKPYVPGVAHLPVMIAALGPVMTDMAGAHADGAILSCVGSKHIATAVVPRLSAAARRANREAPRVVSLLPVVVTADEQAARTLIAEIFEPIEQLPAYCNSLEAQGVSHVADIALVGTRQQVIAGLWQLAEAGVTDLAAMVIGIDAERMNTLTLLAEVADELALLG